MRIDMKQFRYFDRTASYRRRLFVWKIIGWLVVSVIVGSGIAYGIFFSPILTIRDISISGLETIDQALVLDQIQRDLALKKFRYIPWNRNLLFLNIESISQRFLSEYPQLRSATIQKHFFHNLALTFSERHAIGIWCFGENCNYFDETGVLWGDAPHTSGGLLISVQDQRPDNSTLNSEMLAAIQKIYQTLSSVHLSIKNIVIPAETLKEFWLVTSQNYPIKMSLDTDLKAQLRAFRIFLDQKTGPNFQPQYVDLRIDGRIYYK